VYADAGLLATLKCLVDSAGVSFSKGALHSLIESDAPLHLSLSRPLQLWGGQRAAFKDSLRSALSGTKR